MPGCFVYINACLSFFAKCSFLSFFTNFILTFLIAYCILLSSSFSSANSTVPKLPFPNKVFKLKSDILSFWGIYDFLVGDISVIGSELLVSVDFLPVYSVWLCSLNFLANILSCICAKLVSDFIPLINPIFGLVLFKIDFLFCNLSSWIY